MSVEEMKADSADEASASSKERSSIRFPYKNLNDAEKVAKTIFNKTGHGECEFDLLASGLGFSPKSSGFRLLISTSMLFDLVERGGADTYKLTELGTQIVDRDKQAAARVEAFFAVPLFKQVYDKYRGSSLPPTAALEREVNLMGVAEKQKDRARQVLVKSAEQAGFFSSGKDRLVKPATQSLELSGAESSEGTEKSLSDKDTSGIDKGKLGAGSRGSGGGGVLPPDLDPIIAGLIARLPKSGESWPSTERTLWLGILESSFELVYKE